MQRLLILLILILFSCEAENSLTDTSNIDTLYLSTVDTLLLVSKDTVIMKEVDTSKDTTILVNNDTLFIKDSIYIYDSSKTSIYKTPRYITGSVYAYNSINIKKIEAEIVSQTNDTLIYELGYLSSGDYNGVVYFPDSEDLIKLTINIYDSLDNHTGTHSYSYSSLLGSITFPRFYANNILPEIETCFPSVNGKTYMENDISIVTSSNSIFKGLSARFSAKVYDKKDGYINYYRYDFNNDGTWDIEKQVNDSSLLIEQGYTFSAYGKYNYTLQIEDNNGNLKEFTDYFYLKKHVAGDIMNDGIVAYTDSTGENGAIMSFVNVADSVPWGINTNNIGITSQSSVDGISNTLAITQEFGDSIYAALSCLNYEYNSSVDWYLPSKGELHATFMNTTIINDSLKSLSLDTLSTKSFWSSTEDQDYTTSAFYVNSYVSPIYPNSVYKLLYLPVRAFHKF